MVREAARDLAMKKIRSHRPTPSDTLMESKAVVNCPKNDSTVFESESSNWYDFMIVSMGLVNFCRARRHLPVIIKRAVVLPIRLVVKEVCKSHIDRVKCW